MEKFKKIFQLISYLQYPLILLALFFSIKPYFKGLEYMTSNLNEMFESFNYFLIFAGLSISFSTLQDTTKTQNNFSKKIWESPKKGKRTIITMAILTFSILSFGIYGYFFTKNERINELAFGMIVLGIGLIGLLKSALEIFENHRKDKK